jgi:hypothetical protein
MDEPTRAGSANKYGFRHIHSFCEKDERLVWNVERLWDLAKNLEPKWIDVESVDGIDRNGWFTHSEPTLRNVAAHAKQIQEADLGFPIILNTDGSIMDGAHRVAKALVQGIEKIQAVRFKKRPQPDVVEKL